MIEYIKGEIAELSSANAVIDYSGLGYAANISLNTYVATRRKKECKLYIHEVVRGDAYALYRFIDKQEHELFLLLISVSNTGGNTARMILSALSPSELINVVSAGNVNPLKIVKGTGLKIAQRVIVDPKDKIKPGGIATETADISAFTAANAQVQEEAVAALTMLEFIQAPSREIVMAILREDVGVLVGRIIKLALKRL